MIAGSTFTKDKSRSVPNKGLLTNIDWAGITSTIMGHKVISQIA